MSGDKIIKIGALVAVYGSLRAGLGNHRILETAVRQADGVIKDKFRMVSLGGFPGLLNTASPTDVVVEVYEVDSESRKARLDGLEGYPSFYDREVVTLVDGREAWVYTLTEQEYGDHEKVENGDWVDYVNKQPNRWSI